MTAIESNHPTGGDPRMEALRRTHVYSGKVRDLYTSDAAPGRVLVVASDRVSAFDHILAPAIPGNLIVPAAVLNAAITGLFLYPARLAARRMLPDERPAW